MATEKKGVVVTMHGWRKPSADELAEHTFMTPPMSTGTPSKPKDREPLLRTWTPPTPEERKRVSSAQREKELGLDRAGLVASLSAWARNARRKSAATIRYDLPQERWDLLEELSKQSPAVKAPPKPDQDPMDGGEES